MSEVKPCGICGGARQPRPDGRAYCPACHRRRGRDRRERMKAGNMGPRAPMPHTPAAWARRLEADPALYEAVKMREAMNPREPEPVHRWRSADADFGDEDRAPMRLSLPTVRRVG